MKAIEAIKPPVNQAPSGVRGCQKETFLKSRRLIRAGADGNSSSSPVPKIFLMTLFTEQRTAEYKANLSGYAFLVFAVTLILLYAGGFTTTIGAGMVFLDWPLSNGSLNPPGWTTDEAMLAEHSHRLLGMTVGSLSIGLAVWMYCRESRAWLRRLSYLVLGLVIFQGLLGGLRVLLVSVDLAQIHGILAQLFLCSVVSVAVGASRWWRAIPVRPENREAVGWQRQRRFGFGVCALLVAQLVIGAVMRHQGAGLAIPHFPMSTAAGGILPESWNWATTIHFSHRAMALLIAALLIPWALSVCRSAQASSAMKRLAVCALVLLCTQVALGAGIIWSLRQPVETTLHVLNGALLLSACWATTFAYCRPLIAGEQTWGRVGPEGAVSAVASMPAATLGEQPGEIS